MCVAWCIFSVSHISSRRSRRSTRRQEVRPGRGRLLSVRPAHACIQASADTIVEFCRRQYEKGLPCVVRRADLRTGGRAETELLSPLFAPLPLLLNVTATPSRVRPRSTKAPGVCEDCCGIGLGEGESPVENGPLSATRTCVVADSLTGIESIFHLINCLLNSRLLSTTHALSFFLSVRACTGLPQQL